MTILPDVFEHSDPIARKRHTCDECGATISRNRRYHRVRGLWDGHWSTFKICEPCWDLWATFDEVAFGLLHDRVRGGFNFIDIADRPELLAYEARRLFAVSQTGRDEPSMYDVRDLDEHGKALAAKARRYAYRLEDAARLLEEAVDVVRERDELRERIEELEAVVGEEQG